MISNEEIIGRNVKRRKREGIRAHLKIILEKLHEGLEPKKLDNRMGGSVPHDTLYTILKILKEAGLIYRDEDGKYYYSYRKGIRAFSEKNYKIALNHSKQILLEAEDAPSESLRGKLEHISYRRLIDNEYFLQHLKTGYPEIYELYQKWKKSKEDLEAKWKEFEDEVKREVEEKGFKIRNSESETAKGREVYDTISYLIRRLYSNNIKDIKLGLDRKAVYCEPFKAVIISSDPSVISELRDLIVSLVNSKKLRKIYDECRELSIKKSEAYSKLEEKLKFLVEKVKHGEPLRGYCDLCPMVLVKEGGY